MTVLHTKQIVSIFFSPLTSSFCRDTIDRYSSALKDVANSLFGLMARNLGLEPEIILDYFKDQTQSMRINYYPPCPKANMVLGLTPHTDASGLTLLLQVGEVQGLQIKKDSKWFPIEALPSALIVNIGDILEVTLILPYMHFSLEYNNFVMENSRY